MKYLVASDIHGNYESFIALEKIIDKENPDKIILLGDIYNQLSHFSDDFDPDKLLIELNKYSDKIMATIGNCDTPVDVQNSAFPMSQYLRIKIAQKNFFFTHGHIYNESSILSDVDVFVFGHLHEHFIDKKFNRINVNVGSISLPRNNTKKSFIIIDDEYIYLKDLDNSIIDKIKY